ncbi:MAG: type pilus assembly protein PilQ [Acidobacteriota bacterium]|nr:type pilus assembly protein PilQ [Acidobacteriota bacterium]
MGDVVKSMKRALRNGKAWTLVLAAATMWSGCAAASPESVSLSSEPVPPAAAPAALPATISRLAVVEGAPGTRIELVADSGLVWTTYRDADGALVIELPNARPLAGVGAENPPAGLVSSVDVAVDETSGRPLTRLTVQTRQEAEHTLVAGQNSLHIDLTPVGAATAATVAAATVPAAEETEIATLAEEAAPTAPSPSQPAPVAQAAAAPVAAARQVSFAALGTPDQPLLAPPPTGRRALLLGSVEVIEEGANTVVRVGGDGEFAYSTFQLSNPDRFVIDLDGVVNQSARSSAPLSGEILARIRVSQFKQSPEAVSRVVFDLRQTVAPTIERGPEGLVVRFAASAPDAAQLTMAQTTETPETPETTETIETAAPETTEIASTLPEIRPEPQEMTSPSAFAEPASPAAPTAPDATVATAAETLGASDVQAYAASEAPAVAEPVARVPAPAAVAPAARPVTPRDSSLFEAADMQAEEAPRPAVSSSAVFAQQNVGGTHKEYVGETISLSLKDGDIKDVLRSFAKISGLNVVLQPGVRGTVTVELESVPWDQALDQILKINNLGYELDGNIMRIAPRNVLEAEAKEQQALAQAQALSIPLRTVIKRISYSSASDLARVLASGGGRASGILSQRGSVTVDARTNTLIIKELPTYIDTVIAVIETLDIPEPQVMIEARIIETTKRFSRTLGIRWGFDGVADAAHGNTTGLQFPNNGTVQGDVNVLTGGSNGLLRFALGNILDTFNLDATLQAAESDGLINILSAPKIATLNNESASIQSGLQIPIQTVANNTVTVQFVNATLRLDVTPHVTAEGTVLMDVNIQKREPQLAFAVVGAQNAPISTKEAQTRVIVRDGGTTVIGGIYKVSTDQGQDRVPGLANIPVLGHLFKNRRREDANEELLIFITPRVIKL